MTVSIISVGSILYFKYHYKRLIFYFIEDKRNNEFGILCQTVDNGIICFLFGLVHQCFFSKPQLQLFILLFLQCSWMIFKICLIFKKTYQKSFTEFIMFNAGLVRIFFIITFYFYSGTDQIKSLINGSIHRGLVIITLFLWLQEFIVSFIQLVVFCPKFLARLRLFQYNRKLPQQKRQQMAPFDDSVKLTVQEMTESIIRAKNEITITNLFKDSLKYTQRFANKASSFKPKKVQISKDRIARIFSLNQNNEALK